MAKKKRMIKGLLKAIKGDDVLVTWAPIIIIVIAIAVVSAIALSSGAHW